MFLGHIAQGTRRAEIRHGVALGVGQDVVGNRHEGILLAKHTSVFADKGQTVDVGVDHDAKIVFAGLHLVHDTREVFLQWLGIVGKVAGRVGIQYLVFYAESLK